MHTSFDLWLECEQYADGYPGPQDDPAIDYCNATVILATGEKIGLTVWTFGYLEWLRHHSDAAEPLPAPRLFILPPDLLVSQLNREVISSAIEGTLRSGIPTSWR